MRGLVWRPVVPQEVRDRVRSNRGAHTLIPFISAGLRVAGGCSVGRRSLCAPQPSGSAGHKQRLAGMATAL
jgi:hypothetical protein